MALPGLDFAIQQLKYRRLSVSGVPKQEAYVQTFGTLPDKKQTVYAPFAARVIPGAKVRQKTYGATHVQLAMDIDGTNVFQGAIYKTPERKLERVLLKGAALAAGVALGVGTFKLGVSGVKSLFTLSWKRAALQSAGAYAMYQFGPSVTAWAFTKVLKEDATKYVSVGMIGGMIGYGALGVKGFAGQTWDAIKGIFTGIGGAVGDGLQDYGDMMMEAGVAG